ncbi:MAG: parvulin-like peptidyl-prolyl isomerase [Gammaproteobacteria bacterium]|jgi:peptidyl-prolyl cis-trans isomerase SurA|nr:parvulin-like peptidyl-prolyl isomerase [Gammaproteobacteria bacterium]
MKKLMNKILSFSLSVLFSVNVLAADSEITSPQTPAQLESATPAALHEQALDKILVIVNEDVITESDLNERIKIVKMQLNRTHVKIPDQQSLRKQVLQQMIDQHLQLQAADKLNIMVDNDTLNEAVNNIAKQNKMTVSELSAQLSKDGISYQDFRNAVRDEIIISRVQERVVKPQVIVTPQEVNSFLNAFKQNEGEHSEYRLADIVIGLPEAPSPEEIKKAESQAKVIVEKLQHGTDFEMLASSESSGGSALSGGDLGWRSLARLPTIFAEKVQTMKKGDIAGPFQMPNGFHIIKLTDVRGSANNHVVTETKARHILIKTDAVITDEKAKAQLLSLRNQLEKGASFAALAKQYSVDPGSAAEGGELGWVTDDELVPEFAKAMDALSPGQISQPVKTPFGWHLIEVESRRTQDVTQQYQKSRIETLISQRKYEEAIEIWIRQLRAQAYIKQF